MAVQAGFVAGTLGSALANLADVLNARVLFLLGAVAGAAANAAVLHRAVGRGGHRAALSDRRRRSPASIRQA